MVRIRKTLEGRIDQQSAEEIKEYSNKLTEITGRKSKLLDLYLDSSFTKNQLDERIEPLNKEELTLQATIKALSKSNDEIYHDIVEVDETLAYLREQDKTINKNMNSGTVFTTMTREEVLADVKRIVVEPDGSLTVELKAFEDIDRLLVKHRHLLTEGEKIKKVS